MEENLKELQNCKDLFLQVTLQILKTGNGLYTLDLMASAIANRAIALNQGFTILVQENNYLCALPLIRMQLDNCLRFYATCLVKDYNDFYLYYGSGKPICNYIDSDGNKLTDGYLVRCLEKKFSGVQKLYKETSAYIHLSEQHLYAIAKVNKQDTKSRKVNISVGNYDIFTETQKRTFIQYMISVNHLVLKCLMSWCNEKEYLKTINHG